MSNVRKRKNRKKAEELLRRYNYLFVECCREFDRGKFDLSQRLLDEYNKLKRRG